MATSSVFICQGGCGTFDEDASKFQTRGFVNEKLYCEKCVIVADKYIEERDKIHTFLSGKWSDGLVRLAADFSSLLKNLPDG
jgi:hypothetical protein